MSRLIKILYSLGLTKRTHKEESGWIEDSGKIVSVYHKPSEMAAECGYYQQEHYEIEVQGQKRKIRFRAEPWEINRFKEGKTCHLKYGEKSKVMIDYDGRDFSKRKEVSKEVIEISTPWIISVTD